MYYSGQVHKVGDHIDTDAIIPARFLVTSDRQELGASCMEGLTPGWVDRVKAGDMLVAGENFGCGSSREHAPLALLGAGIPVVVAHSFARIFYRNGFNMGLLLLEVGREVDGIDDGDTLHVQMEEGVITNTTKDKKIPFQPLPAFMQELLQRGGLIEYVKQQQALQTD